MCLRYVPISSSAPRPLGAAYVPIFLSEVEQEQRSSVNGDREAIVVGAGLCDSEGERAYTAYAPYWYCSISHVFWRYKIALVIWPKIFKPSDSRKKLSQMVLSQVTGNH